MASCEGLEVHHTAAKEDGTLTLERREGDRALGFHYSVESWTRQPTSRATKVGEIKIDWAFALKGKKRLFSAVCNSRGWGRHGFEA